MGHQKAKGMHECASLLLFGGPYGPQSNPVCALDDAGLFLFLVGTHVGSANASERVELARKRRGRLLLPKRANERNKIYGGTLQELLLG